MIEMDGVDKEVTFEVRVCVSRKRGSIDPPVRMAVRSRNFELEQRFECQLHLEGHADLDLSAV